MSDPKQTETTVPIDVADTHCPVCQRDNIGICIRKDCPGGFLAPAPTIAAERAALDLAAMLRRMIWMARKETGDTSMKALAGQALELLKRHGLEGELLR